MGKFMKIRVIKRLSVTKSRDNSGNDRSKKRMIRQLNKRKK